MADDEQFDLNLKAASIKLRLPQHTVLKCVRYVARPNGGIRLNKLDRKGETYFRQADLDAYLDDLSKPWVDNLKAKRPSIPDYFEEALRLEAHLRCGLCGSSYSAQIAHIIPWADCHHHHPWNLIWLCTKCHEGFDIEKRITHVEIQRAKERIQADLVEDLQFTVSEEKALAWLKRIAIPIGATRITGIDVLLSLLCKGGKRLEISKIRNATLRSLTKQQDSEIEYTAILRVTELTLSQLVQARLTEPFWEEFCELLYDKNRYPEISIELNEAGQSAITRLREKAADYVDPAKYPKYIACNPGELINELINEYAVMEEWYQTRDRPANPFADTEELW